MFVFTAWVCIWLFVWCEWSGLMEDSTKKLTKFDNDITTFNNLYVDSTNKIVDSLFKEYLFGHEILKFSDIDDVDCDFEHSNLEEFVYLYLVLNNFVIVEDIMIMCNDLNIYQDINDIQ